MGEQSSGGLVLCSTFVCNVGYHYVVRNNENSMTIDFDELVATYFDIGLLTREVQDGVNRYESAY